ncbi:MAG: hypothetical protein KKC18_10550 [Chloroflexi bacterium]|nr:hypothetical protein [Chloroflexota bacterium]
MKEGLLWYDDDPGREMAEKIGRAARRYRQKFGAAPDICYVHPLALGGNGNTSTEPALSSSTLLTVNSAERRSAGGEGQKVGGVRIAPLPSVLRHHFWLGREEKARTKKRKQKAS